MLYGIGLDCGWNETLGPVSTANRDTIAIIKTGSTQYKKTEYVIDGEEESNKIDFLSFCAFLVAAVFGGLLFFGGVGVVGLLILDLIDSQHETKKAPSRINNRPRLWFLAAKEGWQRREQRSIEDRFNLLDSEYFRDDRVMKRKTPKLPVSILYSTVTVSWWVLRSFGEDRKKCPPIQCHSYRCCPCVPSQNPGQDVERI